MSTVIKLNYRRLKLQSINYTFNVAEVNHLNTRMANKSIESFIVVVSELKKDQEQSSFYTPIVFNFKLVD